jgi:hypothetical protein
MEEAVSSDTNKLEGRIGAALSNGSASSADLMELITTASAAPEAAAQAAAAERDRALDVVSSPDPAAAHAAVAAAELYRDRLAATVPRLRQRLTEALAAEHHARWFSDYLRVEKRRNAAADKFARHCPELLAGLVALFREAEAVDQECMRVNGNAPANEPRRLVGVELHARGMTNYTSTQPSLSTTVRLPDYAHSDIMAWPVPQPHFAATFAASMPVSRDIRHTNEWWKAAEADAAERRQIAERRAAQHQAADAARRAEYERTLLKQAEERERRAHEARRRA